MYKYCRSGLWFLVGVVFVGLAVGSAVSATVISYQGRLTDDGGTPVSGTVEMRFTVYDAADVSGDNLWQEEQSVDVDNGIFSVALGAVSSFPDDIFEQPACYLEVAVIDTGGTEVLSPRLPITFTARAVVAEKSRGLTDGALTTVMIADGAVTADQIANGSIGAADMADNAALNEILDDDGSGSGLDADLLDGKTSADFADKAYVDALEERVAQLETLLAGVIRSGKLIQFSGVNVQIVNGTGTTDGDVTGLGNLIVGYNELRGAKDVRSGSHNLIVGSNHNYSSYGGLVVGQFNTISAAYTSVSGGMGNKATNAYASVSGGYGNDANAYSASVSGGRDNTASGDYASVSGGAAGEASGDYASVGGGLYSTASGNNASVSGGRYNTASGAFAFVGGGGGERAVNGNVAFGNYASVTGGANNIAGDQNLTYHSIGEHSSVAGGLNTNASGDYASVSGGRNNTASGDYASVSGGRANQAIGESASVSGGAGHDANHEYDWRAGSLFEEE